MSGIASGKTAISPVALASFLLARGERRKTARVRKEQLDRLQQEQNARGRLKSRDADVQQTEKIGAADREDDEHHAGNSNSLDGEPLARRMASAARQYPENGRCFERADRDQQHDNCRRRKFEVAPHPVPSL